MVGNSCAMNARTDGGQDLADERISKMLRDDVWLNKCLLGCDEVSDAKDMFTRCPWC